MTTGAKTTARVRRLTGVFSATSSAIRKPRPIRIGVMMAVYLKVKPSAPQNCGSAQAFTKLPAPTNFFSAMSDQLCSDIHTICTNGQAVKASTKASAGAR